MLLNGKYYNNQRFSLWSKKLSELLSATVSLISQKLAFFHSFAKEQKLSIFLNCNKSISQGAVFSLLQEPVHLNCIFS